MSLSLEKDDIGGEVGSDEQVLSALDYVTRTFLSLQKLPVGGSRVTLLHDGSATWLPAFHRPSGGCLESKPLESSGRSAWD